MEGKTISLALVEGVVVLAHADNTLDGDEWRRFVAFMQAHADDIEHVLVLAAGSGPDPVQREHLANAFMKDFTGKAAIVTRSRVLRGVITVMGWLNRRVRPFEHIEQAVSYLDLDSARVCAVLETAERLRSKMLDAPSNAEVS